MTYVLFRYLHFFAIFALAGALLIENMAIKPVLNSEDARNLAKVDAVYGIAAVLVAVFGFCLWFWFGKPSDFYTYNPVFLAKIGLFISIALISIYPTLFFIKHRKTELAEIPVPKALRTCLKVELILLCIIPLLAILMARGVGF